MGAKEDGLLTGTYYFIGLFVAAAIILGQYVHYRTKDREAASSNRFMTWGLTMLGVFCMWTMWSCVYMAQMYPLIQPTLITSEH